MSDDQTSRQDGIVRERSMLAQIVDAHALIVKLTGQDEKTTVEMIVDGRGIDVRGSRLYETGYLQRYSCLIWWSEMALGSQKLLDAAVLTVIRSLGIEV